MTQLLNALKSYIILSLSDLTQIKEAIARRYGHMTSNERAEILSMAVHNHLNKHLSGIDDVHKEALKLTILSNTLAKHHYSITRLTIFDAILDLSLDDAIKTNLAESWLTESAQLSVPRWLLENYMIQKRSNFIDSVQDIDQPTYFDDTDSFNNKALPFTLKKWTKNPLIRIFAVLLILIAIATPAYFALNSALNGAIRSEALQVISLTSLLDAKEYTGMSARGRIYLIDDIEGYKKNDHVYLTLKKSRVNFGLVKITDAFRFSNFNYYTVKNYISKTRNGLIGSSEQFNQIIHEAYLNDIDPLLLFAIIGQEQGFVPSSSANSVKILNNPYNVYHSWAEYNTSLRDSTQIAINTIKNRLNTAPISASPFKWLNMTYAEDTNWHNGVRLIYAHLISIGRESSIQ